MNIPTAKLQSPSAPPAQPPRAHTRPRKQGNALETRDRIVALAQQLIQERGVNGFSYRDLADAIGIKTASIHYYFPQKDDLLLAVMQAYHAKWRTLVDGLAAQPTGAAELRAYLTRRAEAYGTGTRVCLGAAMAADIASLPASVRAAVQAFYLANEAWLTRVLKRGREDGSLIVTGDIAQTARAIYDALQGGLLSARLFGADDRTQRLAPVLEPWVRETTAPGDC